MSQTVPSKKSKTAAVSIAASFLITGAKFIVAFATGSLGVLSEALHSLIDLGATIVTWFAVRLADAPADDEHHYGHARIENIAALGEAALLFLTAIYIAYEAVSHLLRGSAPLVAYWWAFVLIGLGVGIDFWRSGVLRRVAVAESSPALAADAKHFEADIYASLAVLMGLAGATLGLPLADAIAALLVSGFVFWLGIKLGIETISTLLDRAPQGASSLLHQTLIKEPSVLSIERIRVREVGAIAYVSFTARVPRSLATSEIASLSQKLQARVRAVLPAADVNVSLEPVALDTETAQQKISAIAAQHGFSIHHLVVQDVGVKRAVSFDVEMEPALSLGAAHERATKLENAIRAGLGGDLEVESHIEPRPQDSLRSLVAGKPEYTKVELALKAAVRSEKALTDIHNLRLRRIGRGLYLHYHCRFKANQSLENCHTVLDRIEGRLMAKIPHLKRVVAHAEPIGAAKHKL